MIRIDIDSREHEDKNLWVLDYFDEHFISYRYISHPTADYTLFKNTAILVDRKSGIMELAQDCFQDHDRFKREMIRAKENNQKLFILVEDEYIYNINGVKYFKIPIYKSTTKLHKKGQPMAQFKPEILQKVLITQEEKYGVKYIFVKHNEIPEAIIDILLERRTK